MTALNNDEVLKNFGQILAKADEKERQGLLKRVQLIAMNEADPEVFEPPVATLGEYLDRPIEVPPTLVEPTLVVRGGLVATIGRAGKGKTVMSLNRILRWAAGQPMFDGHIDAEGNPYLAPTKPLKTLVIENEGSAGMFHKQIGIMVNAKGYLTEADRKLAKENVLIWGEGGWSGLKLDKDTDLNNVRTAIEKFQPDIVFLEPFRGLWQGEENSATEMSNVVDALVGIATQYNCAVMISHHERKSGAGDDGEKMSSGRGSTVLEGAATIMENFESVKGGDFRELSWSKSRYAPAPQAVRMEWDAGAWWYKHIPLDQIELAIIDTLKDAEGDALTVEQFKESLEESDPKVRKMLKRLVEDGKVKRTTAQGPGGFRYRLTVDSDDGGSGGLDL